MTRALPTATALAAALIALGTAAGAGPAPVQLAQMNVAPKIQPAPPPNLARPPAITPKIDMSRLAGEKDETKKETDANPEQVPQEAATDGASAPELARQSPEPPAARFIRAPLPQARPDLFGGMDPDDLIDARGAAEAREAAEAAATAGVGVERSDLSGLGDPLQGDQGGDPGPQAGGMSPDEFKERFGLGGMKSPEDIAAGMATEFNDLGNRGVSSPAGDFAAGARPDPSTIPRGDLASDQDGSGDVVRQRTIFIRGHKEDTGWQTDENGVSHRAITHYDSANRYRGETYHAVYPNGDRSKALSEVDENGNQTFRHYERRDSEGNLIESETEGTPRPSGEGIAELQTPESAPGGVGGCAPSDGSAACQEWRRLMREGNSPARMLAGAVRVNPGDPDDGATGDGPRIRMSAEDLLGNPDPNSLGRGGAGSAQGVNDGTQINVEGGGTGAGQ